MSASFKNEICMYESEIVQAVEENGFVLYGDAYRKDYFPQSSSFHYFAIVSLNIESVDLYILQYLILNRYIGTNKYMFNFLGNNKRKENHLMAFLKCIVNIEYLIENFIEHRLSCKTKSEREVFHYYNSGSDIKNNKLAFLKPIKSDLLILNIP